MQQQPMSLLDFQNRFFLEEACEEHLFKLRWPEGFRCPRCGHDQVQSSRHSADLSV